MYDDDAQFVHSVLGDEGGEIQLVYEGNCCLAWGIVVDRRRDGGVVYVFSVLIAGGSVCVCVRVYTHAHTNTAGYSDVSQVVGMRLLEGTNNPD